MAFALNYHKVIHAARLVHGEQVSLRFARYYHTILAWLSDGLHNVSTLEHLTQSHSILACVKIKAKHVSI